METETEYGTYWPADGGVEPAASKPLAEELVALYPQWEGVVVERTITKGEWRPA